MEDEMGKKYKNSPIIEALCEIQLVPSQPWDLTLPGLVYEKVKDQLPEKKQQIGVGVQFRPTEKGLCSYSKAPFSLRHIV